MRVFRPRYRDRHGRSRALSRWYVEIRFRGRACRIPGVVDHRATTALGRKLERLAALREVGEKPTGELAGFLAGLSARLSRRLACIGILDQDGGLSPVAPLGEVLDAWERSLRDSGATERHVLQRSNAARRALLGSGAASWGAIAARRVEARLAELRSEGRGLATSNAHLAAARQFIRWGIERGLPGTDPLRVLRPLNARTDRRVQRRALAGEELQALVAAAGCGPSVLGMDGPSRALLYRLAAETGLRANELRSLQAGSFQGLDGPTPTVRLQARYSKRRRDDTLPLRLETARAVAARLASLRSGEGFLDVPHRSAPMIRVDLDAAGVQHRPDSAGRIVDFHALRVTFISNLARAGVPMRLAQTLARHSTPLLTFNVYAQLGDAEERRALEALPDLGKHALQHAASSRR